MNTRRYDRAMWAITIPWLVVLFGVLVLAVWDVVEWGLYWRAVVTSTLVWMLLSVLFSSLAVRYGRAHRGVRPQPPEVFR